MSKDATKEEIKFLTEIFRLGAILTLAVSRGTISLILGERTTLKKHLCVAGFIATVVLGMLLYRREAKLVCST
jgi:hypothetical protein